jgi:hypothetical protein
MAVDYKNKEVKNKLLGDQLIAIRCGSPETGAIVANSKSYSSNKLSASSQLIMSKQGKGLGNATQQARKAKSAPRQPVLESRWVACLLLA